MADAVSDPRFRPLRNLIFYRLLIVSGLFLISRRSPLFAEAGAAWPPLVISLFFGALFLLSLIYALWLWKGARLSLLARIQCALDPFLAAALILLTGGSGSPFFVLFALTVLNAALLVGRRDAFASAGVVWLLAASIPAISATLFGQPLEMPNPDLVRRLGVFGLAFFFIALLGGALAEHIARLQAEAVAREDSFADLASLHGQIVEAIPFGLITVNRQGVIHTASPQTREIFGDAPGVLKGNLLSERFPALAQVVEGAGEDTVYLEMKDGERIFGVNVSPVRQRDGTARGALAIIRDLTERKSLEAALKERDKLSWSGRMAAYMAHEIRNPLAAISSAAQMIDQPGMEGTELKRIIREEVDRLKQLTTDYLIFARPSAPTRVPVELASFLKGMAEQLARDPRWTGEKEGRRLSLRIPEGLTVSFDPNHLRQIFWNLLINAAQAVEEERGEVTVTAKKWRKSGAVTVTLADNGPGLSPALLKKVLEPFYTTRTEGTGLGLAVVQQLATANSCGLSLANRDSERVGAGGLAVTLTMEEAGEADG